MKPARVALLAFLFLGAVGAESRANTARIVSGQILIGGTSYGTPDYQTYVRFYLEADQRMPKRRFAFIAEQTFSVFQNFPAQPAGDLDFSLQMPYRPNQLQIDGQTIAPVWYADCFFWFKTSLNTPSATPKSPQFVTVESPFKFSGSFRPYGAFNGGFRLNGFGTTSAKFEKLGSKYYVLEVRYIFTDPSAASNS